MSYNWNIQLFAGLAQRFNTSKLTLSLAESAYTVRQLKQHISSQFPELEKLISTSYFAANQNYCHDDQMVHQQDELALLPPVSGGQSNHEEEAERQQTDTECKYIITPNPILVEAVMNKVITPACGATLLFVGTTREFTEGQRTVYLHYEAYEPMAVKMMQQIGDEIAQRWQGADVAITHRIGQVDLAEISVVIAVATARREDCYAASRYAIERLKQIVPIWKKEIWEDGSEWKGHQLGPWDPTASAPHSS